MLVLLSGHRAGDRLAPRDRRRTCAATCSSPRWRGAGRARRAWSRSAWAAEPAGAADVRARRVRARRRSARSSGAACARAGRCRGEPVAGRARLAGAAQPPPLRRLPRARRAWRCCSSASPRPRASSTCTTSRSSRARPRSRRLHVTYVKPTAELHAAPQRPAGADRPRRAAARRARRRQGRRRCAPSKSLLPVDGRRSLGPVSRFFEGEATSEVGLRRRPAARHLDRGRARHRRASAAHRRGRQGLRRAPTS